MSAIWIGRSLTFLFAAFMVFASIGPKLLGMGAAVESLTKIGWDARYVLVIGIIELTCLVLYLFPRTSVLGAILMTGLLGGAIASQLRADSPLFTHTLFGLYLGLAMWGGLWLRDGTLGAVFPIHVE